MKIFILAGTMLLSLGASSQAQFLRKPDFPRYPDRATNLNREIIGLLKKRIALLQVRRSILLQEYFPDSPEVRAVEAEIRSVRARLKMEQRKSAHSPASKYQLLSSNS